jgi:hypothetical protein
MAAWLVALGRRSEKGPVGFACVSVRDPNRADLKDRPVARAGTHVTPEAPATYSVDGVSSAILRFLSRLALLVVIERTSVGSVRRVDATRTGDASFGRSLAGAG